MKYLPVIVEASIAVFSVLFGIGFVVYAHSAGL